MDSVQKVEVCAKTDIGFKRNKNEDRYLILDGETEFISIKQYGRLYALADGMGGHAGGEFASEMACKGMADFYSKTTNDQGDSDYFRVRLRHLKSTLHKVHNKIVEYGQANREYDDMGTTSYPLNDKCDRLVESALEMGGKDNVTVIFIQV